MQTKTILTSALIVLGLSGAAFAQAATDFVSVDTDTSGTLSWTEVSAAWPDLTEDAYAAADADASGELDDAEYTALTAAGTEAAPAM